jgi:type IV secretory pathway TraG/TraD family ATPase VirD4
MFDTLKDFLSGSRPVFLRVPREEEAESALLLGDPGTGKSQILHQVMAQLLAREPAESVACYDPACEFLRAYYDAARGDVIFNPLDARCPFWSPSAEVSQEADCEFVAESFFPGRHEGGRHPADFFNDAARIVFARMLARRLAPAEMLEVMRDERLLDELMEGTEHAYIIDAGAKGQRAGVLATLGLVLKSLKHLPRREECHSELSLTEWARARRGVLFITGTPDTREALRPLHAPALNILLKRLRGGDEREVKKSPCAVLVDEAHTLGRLPALSDALVEGRKYAVKLWLGAQNKTQWEDLYGRLASTILAAPHLKIFLRCGEAETARWVSEMIGEEERERPRVGATATVQSGGRDSVNYSTHTERRALVSKEEVMSLANLTGYWKYERSVVPFRLEPHTPPQVTRPFVPRVPIKPRRQETPSAQGRADSQGSGAASPHAHALPSHSAGRVDAARDISYSDIDPNF